MPCRCLGASAEPARSPYRHADRLGSTVALSDSQGRIIERRSFDAFGQTRNGDFSNKPNGTLAFSGPETRGFTEHEHLDQTYLIHMNGRTYDYRLGRFLAVDPFIQFPTNSQSLNPYSYILNNPLSGTDPSGYLANCGDISASSGGSGTCTFEQDGKSVDVAYSSNEKGVSVTASNGGNGARLLAAISASDRGSRGPGNGGSTGNSIAGANRTDSGSKSGETTAGNVGNRNRSAVTFPLPDQAPVKVFDFGAAEAEVERQARFDEMRQQTFANEGLQSVPILPIEGVIQGGLNIFNEINQTGGLSLETTGAVMVMMMAPTMAPGTGAVGGGVGPVTSVKPANFSPVGAGRSGAFNEAKRRLGIPTSQQPSRVLPNVDRRGNPQPGRIYEFKVPAPGGRTKTVTIRDDASGHDFGSGNSQNRGPHFNDEAGNHYDY